MAWFCVSWQRCLCVCVCVRNRVVSDNAVLRNVCTDGAHVLTTCNEAVDANGMENLPGFVYVRLPVVPHKAVRSFKMGSLQEGLVVVMHGWQSESTDGPEGGCSCVVV